MKKFLLLFVGLLLSSNSFSRSVDCSNYPHDFSEHGSKVTVDVFKDVETWAMLISVPDSIDNVDFWGMDLAKGKNLKLNDKGLELSLSLAAGVHNGKATAGLFINDTMLEGMLLIVSYGNSDCQTSFNVQLKKYVPKPSKDSETE